MRSRFLIVATFLLATLGCYRVRPLWKPEEFLARAKPDVVYVRQRNRPVIPIAYPRLAGDTLRGTGLDGGAVAVAWSDVMDVQARRFDGTRTVFAVSGMTLLSGFMVSAFLQAGNSRFHPPCDLPAIAYEHDLDPECAQPRQP